MKVKTSAPRIPRTRVADIAWHHLLLIQARESRQLGWRREAAVALNSAALTRSCILIADQEGVA